MSAKSKKQSGTQACAVSTCSNPLGVSYHRFPKELQIRKEWIYRCKKKEPLNPNTSRICELHFSPDDFERDLKNELLGLPQVKRLKKNVIPTLNIPIPLVVQRHEPSTKSAGEEKPQGNKISLEGILEKSRLGNVDWSKNNQRQSGKYPLSSQKQSGTQACAVSTCSNPLGVSYHRFPKDPQIRKEWIFRCKRKEPLNPNTSRICELHFSPDDFERDLKNELLGLPLVKRLKKSVIPTLNIPSAGEEKSNEILPEGVLEKSRLGNADWSKNCQQQSDKDLLSSQKESIDKKEALYWKQRFCRLESCHKKLKHSYNQLRIELRDAKKNIRRVNSRAFQNGKMKEFLRNHYSNSKVKKILNPGTKFCQSYDRDDVTVALALRSISNRAFEYLRSRNALPLPSKRTLERWLTDFRVEPGLQVDTIKFLQEMCHAATNDSEKMAVICFGEMLIKKSDECNKKLKKVIGPNKMKCQVVMVRGLIKNWNQPIFYEFNKSMDRDLLYFIILKLEEVGVKVLAVSFDLENTKLNKELEIDSSNSFSNPADDSREILLFPDAPTLIKLIRNQILDKGLQLPDGNGKYALLGKEDLRDIIERQDHNESNIHHKMSVEHLTISGGGQRQIRMACQLFSRITADAFHNQSKFIQADAINIINDWFDCMGGCNDANLLKCDEHLDKQERAFNKMKQLIMSLKVNDTLLPWQRGILVSMQSTTSLYNHLQTQGVQHCHMERLNKDILEDFFSRIRSLGGDNSCHPSSSEFIQRFKILLIEKNPSLLVKKTNMKIEGSEEHSFQSSVMAQNILEINLECKGELDIEENSLPGSEKEDHS